MTENPFAKSEETSSEDPIWKVQEEFNAKINLKTKDTPELIKASEQVTEIPESAKNKIVLNRRKVPYIKVPVNFIFMLLEILKNAGADSMSQIKAVNEVNDIITKFNKELSESE